MAGVCPNNLSKPTIRRSARVPKKRVFNDMWDTDDDDEKPSTSKNSADKIKYRVSANNDSCVQTVIPRKRGRPTLKKEIKLIEKIADVQHTENKSALIAKPADEHHTIIIKPPLKMKNNWISAWEKELLSISEDISKRSPLAVEKCLESIMDNVDNNNIVDENNEFPDNIDIKIESSEEETNEMFTIPNVFDCNNSISQMCCTSEIWKYSVEVKETYIEEPLSRNNYSESVTSSMITVSQINDVNIDNGYKIEPARECNINENANLNDLMTHLSKTMPSWALTIAENPPKYVISQILIDTYGIPTVHKSVVLNRDFNASVYINRNLINNYCRRYTSTTEIVNLIKHLNSL